MKRNRYWNDRELINQETWKSYKCYQYNQGYKEKHLMKRNGVEFQMTQIEHLEIDKTISEIKNTMWLYFYNKNRMWLMEVITEEKISMNLRHTEIKTSKE